MPTVDGGGFAVLFAVVFGSLTLGCVLGNVLVTVLVLRRKIPADRGLIAGAVTVLPFVLLIVGARDVLFSGIVAFLLLPVASGIVTAGAALRTSVRCGSAPRTIALQAPIVLACVSAIVYAIVIWEGQRRREALDDAVRRDDVAIARSLLEAGAARGARDAALRQQLLWQSCRQASPDLVAALLDVGADPRGPGPSGESPLLAAIGSKPMWRSTEEADPATHARNRYRTVEILLDRGADPSAAPRDAVTPAEMAWGGVPGRGVWPQELRGDGDEEILRLLEARGARDAHRLSARFGELMAAAAAGDDARVRAVLGEYRRQPQMDAVGRSPMDAAAENGHLATIDVLLATYGDRVHCRLVAKAAEAAARNSHAAVQARLLSVCGAPR